jgi:outer membrane protein OmpA-like peptidoglycan-associated protein
MDARAAYDRATRGVATQYDPAGVHAAEKALSMAEQSFGENGDSPATRDLAYVAIRRAQAAEARGDAVRAMQQVQLTSAEIEKNKEQQLRQAQADLRRKEQALDEERTRREDAEKRVAEAAAELGRVANVKQDQAGMMITLPGQNLFGPNGAAIASAAQLRLERVAETLKKTDPNSTIVVKAYTDAKGAGQPSQDLSQKQADAVRDFLVSKGVSAVQIHSQGMGAPPAGGAPQARGMNQRVEILVQAPGPQPGDQNQAPPEQGAPQAPPAPRPQQQPQPQPQPQP